MNRSETSSSLTLKLVSDCFQSNPRLVAFDLLSGQMRHRITPTQRNGTCEHVFCGAFASSIAHILEKLTDRSMVFTDPDFVFEINGTCLGDLQVVTAPSRSDGQNTFITFVQFQGDACDLFAASPTSFQSETADIAFETLEKVANQTFEIAASKSQIFNCGYTGLVHDRLKAITKTRDELFFRLALLEQASKQSVDCVEGGPQAGQVGPFLK